MAEGGIIVLDGTHLRDVNLRLPESNGLFTGDQVLEIAESEASSSLFGIPLPENLKSAALKRINVDVGSFHSIEFERDQASLMLNEFITAIADELKDDPVVASILDGNPLRLFLEDEDDFAMLAENLFTDLDTKDTGKISKNEIRNALVHMGVEMGVPPFSEFPLLNEILKKHGAEGEEELGQAQFAELLQPVLQELADALAEKHIIIIQNIKIINGSKLKKLLSNEKQLNSVIEQIFKEECAGKVEQSCTEIIRGFLEKNGPELGLPPLEANETVALLYDEIFTDLDTENSSLKLGRDEFGVILKDILEKFAEQLEANPIFHEA